MRTFLPLAITFFLIFLLSTRVITDIDLGWHLKVGEYIVQTKSIPTSDLFSFSQKNYPYVYHSWASEITLYLTDNFFNLWGVSLLYALISTLSIYFLYKSSRIISKDKASYTYFILVTPLIFSVASARTRAFGFLFFSISYFLLLRFKETKSNLIYLLPLVFLLWANFHPTFLFGLILMAISTLTLLIFREINRQSAKKLIFVLLLSFLATFLNPYGLKLIKEIYL